MSDNLLNAEEKKQMEQMQPLMEEFKEDDLYRFKQNDAQQMTSLAKDLQGDAVSLEEIEKQKRKKRQQKENAERMRILQDISDTRAAIQFPRKSVLYDDFKDTFHSRVSDASRAKKQRNKKSRLFHKAQNEEQLRDVEQTVYAGGMQSIGAYLPEDMVISDSGLLMDLSAFVTEDNPMAGDMIKLYFEEDEKKQKHSRNKALDRMFATLSDFKLEGIDLFNDAELTAHAKELERLFWQLSAFHELAFANEYIENMDEKTKKTVEEKISALESVATYYQFRKDVIRDPMYKTHYNDELSMDFTKARSPEEKALAQKLLKAHLAGLDMMEKNGANAKSITKMRLRIGKIEDSKEGRDFVKDEGRRLFTGSEMIFVRDRYEKQKKDYAKAKNAAEKQSKETNMVPVLSDQEYEEKKNTEGFEGMSESQYQSWGGATTEKVVSATEADRIVKESKGFLTAVKVKEQEGMYLLKPSLPATAEIEGKQIALRKSYNLFMKSYMILATNEDGSFKKEAGEKDGICDQFDFITSVVNGEKFGGFGSREENEQNYARVVAQAKGYLQNSFMPVIKKLLEEDYVRPDATQKQREIAMERAGTEAAEVCDAILLMVQNANAPLISDQEVSMKKKAAECSYLMDTKPEKLKEILSGFALREIKIEDGKETVTSRPPTSEEMEEVIAELKQDVLHTYEGLKQVRNMDHKGEQIPIPNTCSANTAFTRVMKKLSGQEARPQLAHNFQTYAMTNPEKVRLYIKKNLYLLADAVGMSKKGIEDAKKELDQISFQKDETFTPDHLTPAAQKLLNITQKLNSFEYHVAANICTDPQEGLITVEGMAATSYEYMVSPFTMNPYIGHYYGKTEGPAQGTSTSKEGFTQFNNTYSPYASNVKSALKTRLKLFLMKSNGEGLA